MRNTPLPFLSPFNKTEEDKDKDKNKNIFDLGRDTTIPNLAEEKKKKLLEAEQKRIAERKARTAEKIKEEGGVKSYRTRKLDDAKEERKQRQKARKAIRTERKKKFGEGSFGTDPSAPKKEGYFEKDKEERREKRDNIKQLRKELQNKNREIRKNRAEKKKQAWIDKKVAKGVFKNAAEAEKRFESLKANTVKSNAIMEGIINENGNLANSERAGTTNDDATSDTASDNSDSVLEGNANKFLIKGEDYETLFKV
tara:strand:- start:52 stop:813 length:762 start_codon:yes stop_codon:yes gene_type:complete